MMLKNERGVLHLPLALTALIFVVTGLGVWGILHHWKTLMKTQLRLDRCTGETALELKDKLGAIGQANRHIDELRKAEMLALAAAQVEVAEGLQVAAQAESFHQDAVQVAWKIKQLKWTVQTGCGSGDVSSLLPSIDWTREPPDELGPQPIDLKLLTHPYRFEIRHGSRSSAAEVLSNGEDNGIIKLPQWKAHWVQPVGNIGPSLH